MCAEEYRRKAEYFLALAKQLSRRQDKAVVLDIATSWIERAEEAERTERIVKQPKKEPQS
jgi:hypothetical protein